MVCPPQNEFWLLLSVLVSISPFAGSGSHNRTKIAKTGHLFWWLNSCMFKIQFKLDASLSLIFVIAGRAFSTVVLKKSSLRISLINCVDDVEIEGIYYFHKIFLSFLSGVPHFKFLSSRLCGLYTMWVLIYLLVEYNCNFKHSIFFSRNPSLFL